LLEIFMTPLVLRAILDSCYTLAKNSSCFKAKYGSVIVNGGSRVGEGWNHSPNPAYSDCEHLCAGGIRTGIESGTRVELCHSGHAEGWAITQAGQLARGGIIFVAGFDRAGDKFLQDRSLPIGNPKAGFYCTLCIRHIWMAGINGIWVDSITGPAFQTLEEAWETSYGVAIAGAKKKIGYCDHGNATSGPVDACPFCDVLAAASNNSGEDYGKP
jgi:hypothetical protein